MTLNEIMASNDQYALNWSNHVNHIKRAFDTLLTTNEFVDVTLACEGKKISAHKMLLSACSTYFRDLFRDNPCQHPIVILKDVKYQNLIDLLKFIYSGEVSVPTENFESFLKTAELLQISGLTDEEGRFSTTERDSGSVAPEAPHVTIEQFEQAQDVKPVDKTERTEKPISRKPDKPKEIKRKTIEKPVEVVTTKKRKENTVIKETLPIKKEEAEVVTEEHIEDPLELSVPCNDSIEDDLLQAAPDSQRFHDVQDLLADKRSKRNKNVAHRLEERVGKLEASRSYCKGCFVKSRLGQISKDKIKQVVTFCPGCDGMPNYCKACYNSAHKKK